MAGTFWLDYDRIGLDAQYDASKTVAAVEPYFERYAAESARVRAALRCDLDLPYGYEERTKLDLFHASGDGGPAVLFLHGGFWRRMGREFFDFIAEPLVAAGAAVAVASYTLAPVAHMERIVNEARWAFAWLYANAPQGRADRNRLFIVGHSAGGQLAAMVAATDWEEFGMPRNVLKGIVGVSGVYDLEPIRLSFINEWLRLTPESARSFSPLLHPPDGCMPAIAAVGGAETAEFKRQSFDFAQTWKAAGNDARYVEIPEANHYDILLDVLKPGNLLRQSIVDMITLT